MYDSHTMCMNPTHKTVTDQLREGPSARSPARPKADGFVRDGCANWLEKHMLYTPHTTLKLTRHAQTHSTVRHSATPHLLLASAEVMGPQSTSHHSSFWGGWQKIVAQIRGVFRKMITNTPPGGQNLAQNGVFTPRFRLHTGVTRLLDVFFDRASVFFEVGAIPVLLILGTIPFRPRVLTLHVTA